MWHGRPTLAFLAVGDLPAGDDRRAAVAVVEAGGAGARCDAGDLACRASALPGIRQLGSRCLAAWGAARRVRAAGGDLRVVDPAVSRGPGELPCERVPSKGRPGRAP